GDGNYDEIRGHFARDFLPELGSDGRREVAAMRRAMQRGLRPMGLPMDAVADVLASAVAIKKEGDDQVGWRLHLTAPPGMEFPPQDWAVGREDGSYRILGAPGTVAAVGRRVLRLVDAGDLTAAHRWMTWVSPQQSAPPEAMPMQVAYVRARN